MDRPRLYLAPHVTWWWQKSDFSNVHFMKIFSIIHTSSMLMKWSDAVLVQSQTQQVFTLLFLAKQSATFCTVMSEWISSINKLTRMHMFSITCKRRWHRPHPVYHVVDYFVCDYIMKDAEVQTVYHHLVHSAVSMAILFNMQEHSCWQ